ncbi:MAG: DUF1684 domain-containing protein [Thermodesulfobacteriota bacterium]
MKRCYLITLFLLVAATVLAAEGEGSLDLKAEERRVLEWRKERDIFFRTHPRSPLTPNGKRNFKGIKYFSFDPKYVFYGPIKRYIFHINNPKYYATFLTNKGTNKRYIRYGTFRFKMDGKENSIEIYKSILSDNLFIPFKDKTNGQETYEGGRYIDAEILEGYQMILDFNLAYHPTCTYNDKFVCVLPPKENTLDVAIRAGERNSK